MKAEQKRRQEKEMLQTMVNIYCKGRHNTQKGCLCPQCSQLLDYAWQRTDKCPFMEEKTFCSACRVHCYEPAVQQEIKEVMKYAGPRMLLHNPPAALRHIWVTVKNKKCR